MDARTTARRIANRVLIAVFCTAIALPLFVQLLGLESAETAGEKRQLASFPSFRLKRRVLLAFPAKYEAYYGDHFGLRATLIRWNNLLKLRCFHASSSRNVIVGRDGWLFYSWQPVGNDHVETRPFTVDELLRWQHLLEARRDWLAARGVCYTFVIAPDKQTVYPDFLPWSLQRRARSSSRLDQLVEHLRTHSTVHVVDLREPLRAARQCERIYQCTDSHWNQRGAFAGYQHLMLALHREPLASTEFEPVVVQTPGGDLATMLGLPDVFREENLRLQRRTPARARKSDEIVPLREEYRLGHLKPMAWEAHDTSLPRAVIFHDSFGEDLIPFVAEHYRRSVFIPAYVLDPEVVERERPDVVIQLIVERFLQARVPADPPLP